MKRVYRRKCAFVDSMNLEIGKSWRESDFQKAGE